jgi:hypothetical protein
MLTVHFMRILCQGFLLLVVIGVTLHVLQTYVNTYYLLTTPPCQSALEEHICVEFSTDNVH